MVVQVLLALVGGVAVGVLLLVLGFRGKRLNDHPVCRWCTFDLSGVYPGVVTCPECGAGLKRSNAVRIGQRRRRPVALAVGILLTVLPTLGLGGAAFAMLAGEDLNAYKPVGLLLLEGRYGGAATSRAAAVQLADRVTNNKLSKDQAARVVAAALDIQGDVRRPWAAEWGDLIESARLAGTLADDQVHRYRNQAPHLEFRARPRVRAGDPIPIVATIKEARIGSAAALISSVQLAEATIDGQPVQRQTNADGRRYGQVFPSHAHLGWVQIYGPGSQWGMGGAMGEARLVLAAPGDLAPGVHTVRVVLALDTHPQSMNMNLDWGRGIDWKRPTTRPHESTLRIEVVPAATPLIELVPPDPDTTRRLAEALRPPMTWVHQWGGPGAPQLMAQQQFSVDGLPVGIAFDVVWRQGGRDWTIGTLTSGLTADLENGNSFGPGQGGMRGVGGQISGLAKAPIDIVLKPRAELAARTVDLNRVYNGEVVIKDIQVTWEESAGTVTPPANSSVLGAILRGLFGR